MIGNQRAMARNLARFRRSQGSSGPPIGMRPRFHRHSSATMKVFPVPKMRGTGGALNGMHFHLRSEPPALKQVATPERAQDAWRKPPVPVVLVALSQFAKAAFILFFVTVLWRNREGFSHKGQFPGALPILYIALAILIAIAGSCLRNGMGLLKLEKSSRRRVMWNIVEGWMIYGVSFSGMFFGENPFIASWPNRIVVGVLIVDLFRYSCLTFYPDVGRAFGESDEADELLP
jgi:hypothetical protein